MNLYKSKVWNNDVDVVLQTLPEITSLEKNTVLITGAAGLVCSPIIDILIRYNEHNDNKIHILAAGRDYKKIADRFGEYAERDYFRYVHYDATEETDIKYEADYIVHGASNASPDRIINEPVETLLSNVVGLKSLLSYAKEKKVKRVLYISSSEVYGQKIDNQPFKENEYGSIDILNPRNSYSVGKCAAETLCISYATEYNVESVIVRPGHIYGPTASMKDKRVGSAWAFDAAKGNSIVMKSAGTQIRSYVYCLDCASAILRVLLKGQNGKAYNISNPDSIISIRELGAKFANAGGVKLESEIPNEIETKGFNPMQNSSLSSDSLLSIGWKGCFNADKGIEHTIQILKEII